MQRKAKGIVSNPMPKSWYISSENKITDEDTAEEIEHKKFYQSICADKKPYFFIYNYQSLKKEYDDYIANVESKSQSIFAQTFSILKEKVNKSEMEERFVNWVRNKNPIDTSPSVMNKICWAIEKEFDDLSSMPRDKFDHSMLKSGCGYSSSRYYEIVELHKWYKKKLGELGKKYNSEYYVDEDNMDDKEQILNYFIEQCAAICPNQQELCDILVDICYSGRSDKELVWMVCGDTIIHNLLKKNNFNMYYPKQVDDDEEFDCCGHKFVMTKIKMDGEVV